ncbi:hypothetical protein [Bradyrhizobium sp. JYMT SZCCT0428]|uniref:hypothetical protein n=1 Tax=Bradyrhizobium sp. JYMT SZCCT0428 TaxID=2807673 RepID=UPI001BAC78B1|nr:hypothetical protein [Bradyrhizobium sp. JYMT SZCCT0428]MBR1153735.1 hypothetical protein [Bradyrhizobium sp. JYMT SZCCT0428]
MKYAFLILGLLATPALAIDYTPEECDGIGRVFDSCALVLAPKIFTRCGVPSGARGGPDFLRLPKKYPNDWGDINCRDNGSGKWNCDDGPARAQLFDLCQKICDQEANPEDALRNYCPKGRDLKL